jgi:hypothetical protein
MCMSESAYRAALDAALREYETATFERAALEQRISQLQQTIGTLTRLCGFTPTVPLGLSDACRLVLRGATTPMTAVQVRDRLDAAGLVDLSKYANALAAIHTTLKRLSESGEAVSNELDDSSRTAFQLISTRPLPPKVVVINTGAASSRTKRPSGNSARRQGPKDRTP